MHTTIYKQTHAPFVVACTLWLALGTQVAPRPMVLLHNQAGFGNNAFDTWRIQRSCTQIALRQCPQKVLHCATPKQMIKRITASWKQKLSRKMMKYNTIDMKDASEYLNSHSTLRFAHGGKRSNGRLLPLYPSIASVRSEGYRTDGSVAEPSSLSLRPE